MKYEYPDGLETEDRLITEKERAELERLEAKFPPRPSMQEKRAQLQQNTTKGA